MNQLTQKIKNIPRYVWVLLLIILLGTFLRTYHFHNWMRFSMDQSRDALIITDILSGKTALPLLGPLAGGTGFHLGPAYYYFSILSAKIFGNYPDKLAYPSLIFSILAIPLLYFFLREYFSQRISLMLIFLMSIAYFFVETSRFSSNPNLIPFFVVLFLWTFLRFLTDAEQKKWLWPILVGVSLGIGIQLHTTLLVIMPVCAFILGLYALKKNGWRATKFLTVIILTAILLNVTQVVYEFRTDWSNTRQFMVGLQEKNVAGESRWNEIYTTAICQAKSNLYFISSAPVTDNCSKKIDYQIKYGSRALYPNIKNGQLRKVLFIIEILFIWLFFFGGYFLLGHGLRQVSVGRKKDFLIVVTVFNFVALFFLIPVIYSLSVSYFNIIFFVPFVFLGLILEFLEKKLPTVGWKITWFILIVLMAVSLVADKSAFQYYSKGLDNNSDNSDLREVENISTYILENSSGRSVCLSGKKIYFKRFSRPLEYMVDRVGKEFVAEDINDIHKDCRMNNFFYIQKAGHWNVIRNSNINGFKTVSGKKIGTMEIYILKNEIKNAGKNQQS